MVTTDLTLALGRRKLSDKILYSKLAFRLSIIWAIFYYGILVLPISPPLPMCTTANIVHIGFGLGCGSLLLYFARVSKMGYAILGIAFAQFSWTLGKLFWFSTIALTDRTLPYPSVAELGFLGAYFFLIGAISIISKNAVEDQKNNGLSSFWPFVLLVIPILLAIKNTDLILVNISNFILTLAIAFTLWRARPLFSIARYNHFLFGVLALVFADLVFMVGVIYFPDLCNKPVDAIYPLAHSLTAYGLMKGGIKVG